MAPTTRSDRDTLVTADELPVNWRETHRDDVPGQTFEHDVTGAEAAIYEDHGWTVDVTVDEDDRDFLTRHTYVDEATGAIVSAMELHNAVLEGDA